MKKILIKIFENKKRPQGFVLPFTMLISVLVLFVTTSSMTLLSKQLYFSKLYKQSQSAYYAADDAITCTASIDDTYVGDDGLGIFPSNPSFDSTASLVYINDVLQYINDKRRGVGEDGIPTNPSVPEITLTGQSAIRCGKSLIFDQNPSESGFAISSTNYTNTSSSTNLEYGKTISFKMRMDLGLDPSDITNTKHLYRCAKVTVNKTQSFRQIISQGYSTCDNLNTAVERAVVNTTVSE